MTTETDPTSGLAEQAKRLRFAETLLHVSRTVSAMETLDDVLASLVEMTVLETDSDRGTLFLDDPATGELYYVSHRAISDSRSACSTTSGSQEGSSRRTSRSSSTMRTPTHGSTGRSTS